jgi:NaMN:DMB phosphoribosyltransferase
VVRAAFRWNGRAGSSDPARPLALAVLAGNGVGDSAARPLYFTHLGASGTGNTTTARVTLRGLTGAGEHVHPRPGLGSHHVWRPARVKPEMH